MAYIGNLINTFVPLVLKMKNPLKMTKLEESNQYLEMLNNLVCLIGLCIPLTPHVIDMLSRRTIKDPQLK